MAVELMDFYAVWCGPCQVMAPVIEELEKEMAGKVKVSKINVDQDPGSSSKYRVMSIPTYVILKDGQEVDRVIGVTSKEKLREKIQSHL